MSREGLLPGLRVGEGGRLVDWAVVRRGWWRRRRRRVGRRKESPNREVIVVGVGMEKE